MDSKTSTSSLSPPSSKQPIQEQINVDDAFRDRRVISVSIDTCGHNITRNSQIGKERASDPMMLKRTDAEKLRLTGAVTNKDEKTEAIHTTGPVKTHRIVINLDDKNRFTDEVTV